MRYAVFAIGVSVLLLWDAVGNDSSYRHQAERLLRAVLRSLG